MPRVVIAPSTRKAFRQITAKETILVVDPAEAFHKVRLARDETSLLQESKMATRSGKFWDSDSDLESECDFLGVAGELAIKGQLFSAVPAPLSKVTEKRLAKRNLESPGNSFTTFSDS